MQLNKFNYVSVRWIEACPVGEGNSCKRYIDLDIIRLQYVYISVRNKISVLSLIEFQSIRHQNETISLDESVNLIQCGSFHIFYPPCLNYKLLKRKYYAKLKKKQTLQSTQFFFNY